MKILVVDHTKVFRVLWERLATAAGHEPIMASSGTDGMRYLYERKVDLVCVSRVLPDMDGIDFCRGVRATRLGNDLPLILLTASLDNDFRREAFEAGATDIHSKTSIQELFNQAQRYARSVQPGVTGRVLYVEDSATIAVSMNRTLEGMGLEVVHYRNAKEALQQFNDEEFDLVITDILVEGEMSGMAFASRLREDHPDMTAMPIVAMSGYDDLNRRAELFRLGINDFINKPVLEDEVRARVGNLLNSKYLLEKVRDQRQKLFDMAMIDPLTGLYNRNVLNDLASRVLSEANRHDFALSVILLDIDHFKEINDQHGHLVGDEALVSISELLRAHCRHEDIAVRFGGEEILLLMPHCELDDAQRRAEQIRGELHERSIADCDVRASFGVTARPRGIDVEMNDLFRVADQALYDAKESGRDRVVAHGIQS